jgi:hypothetical protein
LAGSRARLTGAFEAIIFAVITIAACAVVYALAVGVISI